MPIAHKDESEIKKVNASNQLAPDALETLNSLRKNDAAETESRQQAPASVSRIQEDADERAAGGSRKYSDTVIARLSSGKRAEFKAFFAQHGVTMNSGIEMCIEYVMDQVESGNARISKAGVK